MVSGEPEGAEQSVLEPQIDVVPAGVGSAAPLRRRRRSGRGEGNAIMGHDPGAVSREDVDRAFGVLGDLESVSKIETPGAVDAGHRSGPVPSGVAELPGPRAVTLLSADRGAAGAARKRVLHRGLRSNAPLLRLRLRGPKRKTRAGARSAGAEAQSGDSAG